MAMGCNSGKPEPTSVLVGTDVVATPTGQAAAVDTSYDPTLMMYAKFPGLDRDFEMTAPALESIRRHDDVSQVPVLVDLLMLLPLDAREDITDLLHDLTGQDIPGDEWSEWVEWLGKHRVYPLRIINPHEMVNDTLGGEPVALSW